jgi:hypothetical protein
VRADHLAREAERLKNDDVLNHALSEMRAETLEALARADATNATEIIRLQAYIAVVDEFSSVLGHYILTQRQDDFGTVV